MSSSKTTRFEREIKRLMKIVDAKEINEHTNNQLSNKKTSGSEFEQYFRKTYPQKYNNYKHFKKKAFKFWELQKGKKALEEILKLIPKTNFSQRNLMLTFEKIKPKGGILFSAIHAYLLHENDKRNYQKVDKFFKRVHEVIRKKALKSKLYQKFLDETGVFYMNLYPNRPFSRAILDKAYNRLLDNYDPNTYQNKDWTNWGGFWSLIKTKHDQVIKIQLFDTADGEMFNQFLKEEEKKASKLRKSK